MSGLSASAARWRYLVLLGLRWFPVGLSIPVTVLLPLERGLSLAELGWVFSVQGFVVLALELPTGGLTDAIGRRPVLLLSAAFGIASMTVYYFAHSAPVFVVAIALMGIYRALDSGPLEAWYVDSALAADPKTKLEGGLSAGGAVLGGAIAAGALAAGGLVAWHPVAGIERLATPIVVGIAMSVVYVACAALLMVEHRERGGSKALLSAARSVPSVIADGVRLMRRSRVLLALLAVELSWGFGMVAFESLTPVRLTEVLGGDADRAAAIMGPVGSAAWAASALGAAAVVVLSRRLGVALSAALMRIIQGGTVIAMGLIGGAPGVIAAFLVCYVIHGASNPLHMTLVHNQVGSAHRATVVSLNSMMSQPAGSIGAIVLVGLAGSTSVTTAMVVGGIVLALAAPLYRPAWRARSRPDAATGDGNDVSASSPADIAALT